MCSVKMKRSEMTQITLTQNGISHTFNNTATVDDTMKAINHRKFEAVAIDKTPAPVDKVREFMIHRR